MNIVYLRVSKEDEQAQDLEAQLPPILSKFRIENYELITDRGSAYNTNKIKERKGFLELLDLITKQYTIKDLFIKDIKQEINLYIFDYNRLFRSIEYGLLFSLICSILKVRVFSVNQEDLNSKENENIGEKIGRYIRLAMYSFLAEGYSKNISDHTKKAFSKHGFSSYSKDGKHIGRKLKNNNGIDTNLSIQETMKLEEEIILLTKTRTYKRVVEIIRDRHGLRISPAYISKLKQKYLNTQ